MHLRHYGLDVLLLPFYEKDLKEGRYAAIYLLTCGNGILDKALNDFTIMSLKQYSHFFVFVVILAPQLGHFIDITSIVLIICCYTSTLNGINSITGIING